MKTKYFLGIFLALFIGIAFANDQAATELATILSNTKTMRANFSQVLANGKGRSLQKSTGIMEIQRPGKFRWTINHPNKQTLIADGRYLWIYDEDLQQVTRKPLQKALGNTPALLLSGNQQNLTEDFTIQALKNNNAMHAFLLKPKNQDTLFKSIQIDFAGNAIQRMVLLDNLGQTSTLRFTQARNNMALNPALFRFKPARGVDVIEE